MRWTWYGGALIGWAMMSLLPVAAAAERVAHPVSDPPRITSRAQAERERGFIPLFDGTGTEGWGI